MHSYHTQPKMPIARAGMLGHIRIPLGIGIILICIWIFLSITPLPPNDLWWHIAAGRTSIQEGKLFAENRWAYTLPASTPYFFQSWLSEILMYGIWKIGDVPLLSLARMVLFTLSYGLMGCYTARYAKSNKAAAVALLLAILAGWSNWTLRPQTFALPIGMIFTIMLSKFLHGQLKPRTLMISLPLLMLLWVNLHGSFVLGIVLVVLGLIGSMIERVQHTQPQVSLKTLGITLFLCLIASLFNPIGPSIFGYLRGMLSNTVQQNWIIEWLPPHPSLNVLDTSFWFFAIILISVVLLALHPKRPSFPHLLWYCAFAWLAFGGVRYIMWFALLNMPLMAQQIAPHLTPDRPKAPQPIALAAIALVGVIALPWFQINTLLGAGNSTLFASQGSYRTLIADTTPIGAGEWLAQNPPSSGHMWTNMTYASYLEWRKPELQQFVDLRVELFPTEIWEQNFTIAAAKEEGMALIDRWQITTLLLDRRRDTKLIDRIKADPGWCERYTDRDSLIFQRCTS